MNLLEILEENNIKLISSSGDRKVAKCPFHEGDNTPSLTIYPNETYYCFACESWGDAVKFLVDYKNMSPSDAMAYVGEVVGTPKRESKVIKVKDTVATWKFLGEVVEDYHKFLLETPGALNYLHKRGLTDKTIRKYKIGYTDGHVLNLVFAYDWGMALKLELINESGREFLSHRITIPNLIGGGDADFLIGRTVNNGKPKYLGVRMPKPLFGYYEVRDSPIIFIAEGQFDWLVLRQWGYPAVILGGSHLTKAHQMLLYEKKVVLIPDNDVVGAGTIETLRNKLSNFSYVDYSSLGVKDISELAQQDGGEEKFATLVKEQQPWIITSTSTKILARWFPTFQTQVYSLLT